MKPVLVDCTNYFNEIGVGRLKYAIEAGLPVQIYIDCIGHTATARETAIYVDWLKEEYGERLVIDKEMYWDTVYYLKEC